MRYNIKIDFVKNRKLFFSISIILTLLGILSLAIFNLNLGVDFKAGTTMDVSFGKKVEKAKVDEILKEGDFKTTTTLAGNKERITIRFDKVLSDSEIEGLKGTFATTFKAKPAYETNVVDPEIARELARKGIIAVLVASLGIIAYISIRFEWRFALAGVLSLLLDAFFVVTVFSIFQLEVNLPFIVAVLTIIGYSINDKIVIFDRIRENLRFAKLKSFDDLASLVNNSIWQTMTRSINTVLTVLIAAVCLFIFGSESIRLFSLAMIIGLIYGTYSSVFIASPLWIVLRNKQLDSKKQTAPQGQL